MTLVVALALALAMPSLLAAQPVPPPSITFEEAIARALKNNPGVAEASQAILRAEALLQQAQTVYRPTVAAAVTTTSLDAARGFDTFVTQPQVQSLVGASVSYPGIAASRWAARAQAQDQLQVARRSAAALRTPISRSSRSSARSKSTCARVRTHRRTSTTRGHGSRAASAAA